jgi:hypothetical protein
MSHRSELEDQYTVICHGCNSEWIDSTKRPGQKYAKICCNCKRTNKWNQAYARKHKNATVEIV